MSQIIPIYIPTYISDQNYNPGRVLPRLLFYNGLIDCEGYYIESGSLTTAGTTYEQFKFPYFDNYNVVSGSFPSTGSNSLLFYNEEAVYGNTPQQSLYSAYWQSYVQLLYNPKTRLINASAIIPLADYFELELNDVVTFRGNRYHLRAINDYNLKNGECQIQLLGPVGGSNFTVGTIVAPTTTTTTTSTTTTTTSTTTTTTTTAFVCNDCRNWEYNGATIPAEGDTITYYSCVDGSTQTITLSSGDPTNNFCNCNSVGNPTSANGTTLTEIGICTTTTTTTTAATATLAWSFSETGGAVGQMDLYVNGSIIESRTSTSNGTYTVYVGDTINVDVSCNTCGEPDNYSNAYCTGIITDADCGVSAAASISTTTYTVVSGNIGTTINLNTFASCDGGCL